MQSWRRKTMKSNDGSREPLNSNLLWRYEDCNSIVHLGHATPDRGNGLTEASFPRPICWKQPAEKWLREPKRGVLDEQGSWEAFELEELGYAGGNKESGVPTVPIIIRESI